MGAHHSKGYACGCDEDVSAPLFPSPHPAGEQALYGRDWIFLSSSQEEMMGIRADRFRRQINSRPTIPTMYKLVYEVRRDVGEDFPYFGIFSGFLYMKEQKES